MSNAQNIFIDLTRNFKSNAHFTVYFYRLVVIFELDRSEQVTTDLIIKLPNYANVFRGNYYPYL